MRIDEEPAVVEEAAQVTELEVALDVHRRAVAADGAGLGGEVARVEVVGGQPFVGGVPHHLHGGLRVGGVDGGEGEAGDVVLQRQAVAAEADLRRVALGRLAVGRRRGDRPRFDDAHGHAAAHAPLDARRQQPAGGVDRRGGQHVAGFRLRAGNGTGAEHERDEQRLGAAQAMA